MANYGQDLINNPLLMLGMGLLSGNSGRTEQEAFSNAMGGGLLGMQHGRQAQALLGENARRDQILRQQDTLFDQQQQDRSQGRQWVRQNFPQIAGAPSVAQQAFFNPNRKQHDFGKSPGAVRNKVTGKTYPVQFGSDGQAIIPGIGPVDWSKFEYLKPVTWLDRGPEHVAAPYGGIQPVGGIKKDVPPEQTPEHKGGVVEAQEDAKLMTKIRSQAPKAAAAYHSLSGKITRVKNAISQARQMLGPFTTGTGAWFLRGLPDTAARRLEGLLMTIKSNLGFQELQAMRENSPTGGALGQVAVQELEMLQSIFGRLDQLQDDDDIAVILNEIEQSLNSMQTNSYNALDSQYGKYIDVGRPMTDSKKLSDPLGIR